MRVSSPGMTSDLPPPPSSVGWQRNLFFAWLSQFFSLAGFCFGMPFVVFYMQELGVTDKVELYIYNGLFNALAPISLAFMGPVWGALGDRYGRKLMMLRASTAATFVLFGMGYAGNVQGLLVFRFLQGFFTGTMPAAQTLIASHTPEERHGFALGTLQTASFTGIMAGGFIGGRCADLFGYAATFKIGGVMMICSTLLILFGIREDFTPPPERAATEPRWRFPPIGAALPVLILVGTVGIGRFIDRPVLQLFVQHLNGGKIAGSSTITGDLTAFCCIAGVIGGLVFGRLVDRGNPARVGVLAVIIGSVMVAFQATISSFFWLFGARFIQSFFMIGLDPMMQTWISRATPADRRGAAFGWYTTFRSSGWFLAPLMGSGIAATLKMQDLQDAWELRAVFLVKAVLLLATIPVIFWTARRMMTLNGSTMSENDMQTERPNIIVLMADDMGYGDLRCYNEGSRIPTPNIDRLAAAGMLFTDAHAPSAVCTPSRYGLLTGRYCWRTRLTAGVTGGYDSPLIEKDRLTLASMLQQRGYHTACIGKWHVGLTFLDAEGNPTDKEEKVDFTQPVLDGPTERGFAYAYYNAACGTCAPPYGFIEGQHFTDTDFAPFTPGSSGPVGVGRFGQWPGMMAEGWVTADADPIITRKACEYIESRADDECPFFLYLTPNAPHEPCLERFVPDFARGKSEAGARGDLVWLFDWIVGQVMETLERTGQAENTLIFITSDNGALPGDFVLDEEGQRIECGTDRREYQYNHYDHKSNADWRGYKAHIWEGGHRIPLIAHWPGHVAPGSTTGQLACLTDLMATCAGITGQPLPADAAEDSHDLHRVLNGALSEGEAAREVAVHHSSFGVFSMRRGQWKVIFDCPDSGGWPTPRGTPPKPGTRGQLYDLEEDPHEEKNLWDEKPEVVAELKALLTQYQEEGRSVSRES